MSNLDLRQAILTKNPCFVANVNKQDYRYTAFQKRGPRGLMLHSVGCPQPSAEVFIGLWNRPEYTNACVHGFIDARTGVAYQTLPWNFRGWHGGSGPNGSSNDTHIGVEMCEPKEIYYTSGCTFRCTDYAAARAAAQRTYNTAVELFAQICAQYGLDPTAPGVIVVSHAEGYKAGIATNHGDPEHLWRGLGMSLTMDGFRKDVKATMAKNKEEVIDMTMTKPELAEFIQKTTGAVAFADVKDVPEWWNGEIQALLNSEAINGGTDKAVNPTDVNLTYTEAKMSAIFVRYVDAVTKPLLAEIDRLQKALDKALAK